MSLLLTLSIFLSTALIFALIAKHLNISPALGYLLAGAVLGFSDHAIVTTLQLWSNHMLLIGAALLLFLIGLQVRLQQLIELPKKIWQHASLFVLICGVLFASLCHFWLQQNIMVSALLGFSLAMSSRLIVLQALQDQIPAQSTLLDELLCNSLFAVLLLAFIPMCLTFSQPQQGLAYLAVSIAVISALLLSAKYVVQPLGRWLAQRHSTDLLWLVCVLTLCLSMLIMQTFSLPLLLGAFVAGVVLAESQLTTQLIPLLAPLKALILAMFFISIGLLTPLHILAQEPLFIGIMLLMLTTTKLLTAGILYYRQQRDWRDSLQRAMWLCASGEMGLILLNLTHLSLELDPLLKHALNLTIILSMLSSTLLLMYFKRSQAMLDRPAQTANLLIIGFGRMGQLIARIAHVHEQAFNSIDNELPHADFLAQYQGHFYHGDATEPNVLIAGGVQQATVVVVCLDDIQDTLAVVKHIQANYPNITLLVRARDREQQQQLQQLGVTHIWCETHATALAMAHTSLILLGAKPSQVSNNIEKFAQHDLNLVHSYHAADSFSMLETQKNLRKLAEIFEKDQIYKHNQQANTVHNTNIDEAS